MAPMTRAMLDGVELEYEMHGQGDPVVFVHHGAGLDWFRILLQEPALAGHRLIHYHRAGYGKSGPLRAPISFEREAADFRGLMQRLDIPKAHVVGHSASACIALQIALDLPDRVGSLALLEPALMAVPSSPLVPRAMELFQAGDLTAAVDTFLRGTCGPRYRTVLEQVMPDAIEQALVHADTFFRYEVPALRTWQFGPDEASRVRQPVLAVVGEKSEVRFHQRQELLLQWLPNVRPFVLAGAGHLLHLENPTGMAEGLAAFFTQHAITAAAS
jgi:pimeloyl-ACP methyl ester carboxylesterase